MSDDGAMDRRGLMAGAAALGVGGLAGVALGQGGGPPREPGPDRLAVVWSSADPDVAHRVCLMYTHAAKRNGWFGEVELVVWGPSQRTLAGDKDLRAKVREMQSDGVVLRACIACASTFGLVDELREIGFEVIGMGGPLTRMLRGGDYAVITF